MDSVSNTAFVTLSRLRPRPFKGGGLGGLLPFCGVLFVGIALAQAPGAPAARPATGSVGRAAAPVAAAPAVTPVERFALSDATAGLKGGGPLYAMFELEQGKKPLSTLRCELYTELTPTTVANFVGLARGLRPYIAPELPGHKTWVRRPLYDGSWIHRVIPDYMIQGGDPQCSAIADCGGQHGMGDAGYSIPDEIRPELRFDRAGRLAMANKGPDTGSAQFFITERATPWLNGTATIFGQCEPLDAISALARLPHKSMNMPIDPVIIKRVIISFGVPLKPGPTPVRKP